MKKLFCKTKTVLCLIFEKSFSILPLWSLDLLLLDFFSWILNSSFLESWFFLMSFLESWNQLLLNLESSWFLLMNLEINLDLELVDSILKSFFWAFCHHQNYLIHHHEACFYNLPIFDDDNPEIKKHIHTLFPSRSLT